MDESTRQRFQRRLRAWYRENGRHGLPWRLTRDPYAVLVSEVMLQQTQVDRVIPYYRTWLDRWPTASHLAAEPAAEVIRAWSGLGYNRRALNLHRAAQLALRENSGAIPMDVPSLRNLPGVGIYTANAVASFAGNVRVAVVDTNIARVLGRAVEGRGTVSSAGTGVMNGVALDLLPARGARDWNLALMDLGAMVCTARSPRCGTCPAAGECAWFNGPDSEPASNASKPATPRFESTARFARGRIVELLRTAGSAPKDMLHSALPSEHKAHLDMYIAALERDGLVEIRGDVVSLPGEMPREE